jgi:hypothetical protein
MTAGGACHIAAVRSRSTSSTPVTVTGCTSISLERVYDEIGRYEATPAVTVEALKLDVREHGPKTLAEPANQERLRRCDAYARDRLDLWMTDFKKGTCL